MAKQQQMIEGTEDVPTARVKRAAGVYTKLLYEWLELKPKVDDARSKLIEKMEEDDVKRFVFNGAYDITLDTKENKKIKCKKIEAEDHDEA